MAALLPHAKAGAGVAVRGVERRDAKTVHGWFELFNLVSEAGSLQADVGRLQATVGRLQAMSEKALTITRVG